MKYLELMNPREVANSLPAFESLLPDDYIKHSADWELLGACDEEGQVLGILAFEDRMDECQIQWLFVAEDARQLGIASRLVDHLIKTYINNFELKPIYAIFPQMDASERNSLENFFQNDGRFDISLESVEKHVDAQSIAKSKDIRHYAERESNAIEFHRLPEFQQRSFYEKMEEEGYLTITEFDQWEDDCVPDLCLCTIDGDEIKSAIFVTKQDEKTFDIAFLYDTDSKSLFPIISGASKSLLEKHPGISLTANIVNPSVEKYFDNIFQGISEQYWYRAEWDFGLSSMEEMLYTED